MKRHQVFFLIVIPAIILILLNTSAQAEKPTHFTSACLELKDTEVNELITLDLDGDGDLEIIIQETRRLSIYQVDPELVSGQPVVGLKQISTFELPEEIWLYDFATFPGEKTMSLIGLTSESVLVFPFQNGTISKTGQTLLQVETLFEGKPTTPPLFRPFCYESYFIIPGSGKFIIAQAKENFQIEIIQEILIQMDYQVKAGDNLTEAVETRVRLPLPYFTDINQDKRAELIFYQDKFLTIYGQGKEGKFIRSSQAPIDLALARRKRRKDSEFTYEILPLIKDINGDGFPDVLVSNGSKGICGVYLNHPQEASFYHTKQPDYLKRIKGWLINHELTDLNNDGLPDLILILMRKVGIMSGLRILLAQSVNWQIEVYYAASSGKLYPDSPNYLRQISIPFTLSLSPGDIKVQTPYLISFAGDFNRDGLRDMILKESNQNILQIYLGRKKGVFESRPSISLTLSSPADFTPRGVLYGVPKISDFNHDELDDILIHQEDFSGRHHFIEVFFSQP